MLSFLPPPARWSSAGGSGSWAQQGALQRAPQCEPHSERFQNLAFTGASNYERGTLSFKHSSADGQSAGLTDPPNGEQVNKYTIRESFTVTALLSHIMCSLNSLRVFFSLFFFSNWWSQLYLKIWIRFPRFQLIQKSECLKICRIGFEPSQVIWGYYQADLLSCLGLAISHWLLQVVLKFGLSAPIVSFVCVMEEGKPSLEDVQISSFFIFLIEYKESLYAVREQIIFPIPAMPWQEEAVFSKTKGYIDHSE